MAEASIDTTVLIRAGCVFLAPTARERFGEALSNSWPGAVIIDTVAPEPLYGVFLIAREGLSGEIPKSDT
jgi:hypothetical protein